MRLVTTIHSRLRLGMVLLAVLASGCRGNPSELTGSWSATLTVDSTALGRHAPAERTVHGILMLRSDNSGHYEIPLANILGFEEPDRVGWKLRGLDSVILRIGPGGDDDGHLELQGFQVTSDSIVGSWLQSAYADGASGTFVLVRQ